MHRARYVGRNTELPCPLWAGVPLFQHLLMVTTWNLQSQVSGPSDTIF